MRILRIRREESPDDRVVCYFVDGLKVMNAMLVWLESRLTYVKIWLAHQMRKTEEIDMPATGVRFLPGHRIRVEIASSRSSRVERNPQTDAANWMKDERAPFIAQQQIFHDAQYASYVSLPVICVRPQ